MRGFKLGRFNEDFSYWFGDHNYLLGDFLDNVHPADLVKITVGHQSPTEASVFPV
jgi:hypothetical protein